MATLLIAGGTGLIGARFLATQGRHFSEVRLLSRQAGERNGVKAFAWDPARGTYDPMAFAGVDYIINLAGAGIADKPWTSERKKLIVQSRVDSLQTLLRALQETGARPNLVLSASATGYYGDHGEAWADETSAPGSADSFLASTTVQWEQAARAIADAGHPLALLRIGIVLSTEGGALPKLLLPLKAGVANYFGDGSQYVPWIHIDDLCALMAWLLAEHRSGVWNGVAPHPVTSKELAHALARAKGAWLTAPVPAFALKMALGAMSETVLTGARVSAARVEAEGFLFRYPHLQPALEHLLG
jgi:uncharacterized protein